MRKVILSALSWIGLTMMPQVAVANLLNNGSFESPELKSGKWKVFQTIDGTWETLDNTAGIEIQNNTRTQAQDGEQYVELDSHDGKNSRRKDTNSRMGQEVYLDEGTYDLSFWYKPRTKKESDNIIGAGIYGPVPTNGEIAYDSWDGSAPLDWDLKNLVFEITTAGDYSVQFEALGKDNTLGGFIDNVSLTKVDAPLNTGVFGFLLAILPVAALRQRFV